MKVVAALVAVAAVSRVAAADDGRAVRRMGFAESGANLVVTTSFPELFDRTAVEKISSGFPSSVVVRMYVFRKDRTDKPVSLVLVEHEIVFDLWDEVYVLRTRGPLGRACALVRLGWHSPSSERFSSITPCRTSWCSSAW